MSKLYPNLFGGVYARTAARLIKHIYDAKFVCFKPTENEKVCLMAVSVRQDRKVQEKEKEKGKRSVKNTLNCEEARLKQTLPHRTVQFFLF